MKLFFPFLSALLLISVYPVVGFSQQIESDLPENWSEPLSDESVPDPSVWSDLNEWYQDHPVPLKNATRQQLLELPGMNGLMADAILNYRVTPGFYHISNLAEIPEIPDSYLPVLEKWITIESSSETKNETLRFSSEYRHRTRFNPFSAEKPGLRHLSNYDKIRLSTNSGWTAGLIAEKDKGETGYADYLNGTVFYQGRTQEGFVFINKFSAGAYQLAFGEGLLFSKSATMGKSSAVINSPERNTNGLSPYLSSDENRFLSGFAGSVMFPKAGIETGVFYSFTRYDGKRELFFSLNEQNKPEQSEDFMFDYSGLHTTPESVDKKDQLPVSFLGGWIQFANEKNISVTGIAGVQRFDKETDVADSVFSVDQLPSRHDRFRNLDSKTEYFSFSGQLTTESIIYSAEVARFSKYNAFAGWILAEPLTGFKYILHRRIADPGFSPMFGRPFADKMSSPGNESGWYHGLEITVFRSVFSLYRDEFLHPWPGYQNQYPSKGVEWFAGIEKRWKENQNLKVQYRHSEQNKETVSTGVSPVQYVSNKYRAEWNSGLTPSIMIKSRIDLNRSVKNYSGKAFTCQIKTSLFETGNLVLQSSWFDARLYEDRIYVYEPDLPGMMSFNPLYGEGIRLSVLAGMQFFEWLKFSAKLSFESSQRYSEGLTVKKNDGFAGLQLDFKN